MSNNASQERQAAELAACENLAARVRYDNGKLFWTASSHSMRNGKEAGYAGARGYMRITASGHVEIMVHRLIFYMHHGYLPTILDHKDGNRTNNRIENLREATSQQNCSNTKLSNRNTSGYKGVSWDKKTNKWRASIKVRRKQMSLGHYDEIQDAVAARKQGEEKYHGEFARQ